MRWFFFGSPLDTDVLRVVIDHHLVPAAAPLRQSSLA